jgi:hypothetical protein
MGGDRHAGEERGRRRRSLCCSTTTFTAALSGKSPCWDETHYSKWEPSAL